MYVHVCIFVPVYMYVHVCIHIYLSNMNSQVCVRVLVYACGVNFQVCVCVSACVCGVDVVGFLIKVYHCRQNMTCDPNMSLG